jgi:protein arginine kinase activator
MWCEQCQQREATVHLTKIINQEKTELHLCEVCAQQAGVEWNVLFEPSFSLQQLLAGMVEGEFRSGNKPMDMSPRCPQCGLTFTDFRQIGLLGCNQCYEAFGQGLDPLFRRVQGSVNHAGKAPRRTGGMVRVRKEIESLRRQLQEAVQKEDYERAAKLRDEIRLREQKLD